MAYDLEEFLDIFPQAGFKMIKLYGDYEFRDFDLENSERMIFILEKI